ncbi:MAG: DUF3240 family protein [Candidatus Sphingomonas colombiensis]|nr:DUF3240 family protein [Sphingomonas sp.]WEK44642.1 MAG: DUF3240 family protein [Sphingomonas sp.]
MADIILSFHCGAADAPPLGELLRAATGAPVHIRAEAVLGHDFSDATTAERVSGRLDRRVIELIVDERQCTSLVAAIDNARRGGPVRWHATPIIARGRLA